MKSKCKIIFPDTVFGSGVIWNLFSFFIMGVSGILLNIFIARYYEPWVLGLFNNVFAIFIISAQIGSLGVHHSVLRHISIFSKDRSQSSQIIVSAIILTIASSMCVTVFIYILRMPLSYLFNDIRINTALKCLAVGLFIFPINKVLLSVLNGFRMMRLYAVGNSLRYIFILSSLIFMAKTEQPGEGLAIVFTIAETMLLIVLLFAVRKHIAFVELHDLTHWFSRHIAFGVKGMGGGVLNELNTRIDVLTLSIFMSMELVGIYSLAAIIVEGISQILTVFRINYDPLIARYIHSNRWDELGAMIKKGRQNIMLLMMPISILSVLFYPIMIKLLSGSSKFNQGQLVFIILIIGVFISSGSAPFSSIIQQGGYPGAQTILTIIIVLINLTGNLIMIPQYGLIGAATATTISQIAFVYILKYFTSKKIKKGLL